MAYKFYNPNPVGRMTNDCSVRALSKALGVTWDDFAQLTASFTALIEEKLSYRKPNKKPYRPKEDESNE